MKGKEKHVKIPNLGNSFGITNDNEEINNIDPGKINSMKQSSCISLVDNTNMEENTNNKKNKYYIYEDLEIMNQCKKYVNFYKWFYYFEEIKLNLDDGVSSFLSHSYNLLLRNRNSKKRNFLMLDCSYMKQKKRQALDDHINRNINNNYYQNIEYMIIHKKEKNNKELTEKQQEVVNNLKGRNIECMLYINDIFDNKRLSILFLLNTKNIKEKTVNGCSKENKKKTENTEEDIEICDMIMLRQSHEIISFYKEKQSSVTKLPTSQITQTQTSENKPTSKVKENENQIETYWSPIPQILKHDESFEYSSQKKNSNHRFKKKNSYSSNNSSSSSIPYQNNVYMCRMDETKGRCTREWSKVVQKRTNSRNTEKPEKYTNYIKREVYESNDNYHKREYNGNIQKQTWKNFKNDIISKKVELKEEKKEEGELVCIRNFEDTPKKEEKKEDEKEHEPEPEPEHVTVQITIEKSRYPNMLVWRPMLEKLSYPKGNVTVDALSVCSGMDGYIQNENFNFDVLINDNYAYLVKYKKRISIYRLIYAVAQLLKDRYTPQVFVPYWWFNHVETCKDRLMEPPDFHVFILNELKKDGLLHVGNKKEEILTLTMDEDDVDMLTKLAIDNQAILCTNNDDLIKYYFRIHGKARVSKFISKGSFFVLTNFL